MGTIDLSLLPVFEAVAETTSFSGAATRLGIPKSSVSRAIASLEEMVGVRLFHRTTRRVSLSTAGAAMREQIAPPLAALQKSLADLPPADAEPAGRLRVTAAVDVGSSVLAKIITRFTARYPAVSIDLSLSNAMVDLIAEGFDVALRISTKPLKDSSLVARDGGHIALRLYASPGYLERRGTPHHPGDLDGHSWIVFQGGGPLRLVGPGKPVTVTPQGRIMCDEMFFVREGLRQDAGIGILPAFLAEADVTAGRLVPVLSRWSIPAGRLWLVYHGAHRLPRKVVAFRDFVLESLRALPSLS